MQVLAQRYKVQTSTGNLAPDSCASYVNFKFPRAISTTAQSRYTKQSALKFCGNAKSAVMDDNSSAALRLRFFTSESVMDSLNDLQSRPLTSFSDSNGNRSTAPSGQTPVEQVSNVAMTASEDNRLAIFKIEEIFEDITDCILDRKQELVINLKCRRTSNAKSSNGASQELLQTEARTISFPGKTAREARQFSNFDVKCISDLS